MLHHGLGVTLLTLLLGYTACQAAWVLPVKFQPQLKAVGAEDAVLYELYMNTSLFGVFITGLGFGTPKQQLQLLIDTGSSITHVAGMGCGSSCAIGLPEDAGFDVNASTTAKAVPCGDSCACPQCSCLVDATGGTAGSCNYDINYLDQSSSSGQMVTDLVYLDADSGVGVDLMFGVEQRQTGKLQGMGTAGILALNRSPTSFVGQLHDSNSSVSAAFATCWELDHHGSTAGGDGGTATSYLLLGQPATVLETLDLQWTPLAPWTPKDWAVQLTQIDVQGEGGGSITSELYPAPTSLSKHPADVAAKVELPPPGVATALVDSGTTYTLVPTSAWATIQKYVIDAAAACGIVQLTSKRPTATCWSGLPAGVLGTNYTLLKEAFPTMRFWFAGNTSFQAGPEGFLFDPENDGSSSVCLSVFPTTSNQVILGNRIRQRVLTLQDGVREQVGFAAVDDCQRLSDLWAQA